MDRRTMLKGGLALATASHTPIQEAVPADAEHPLMKVRRLGKELAAALSECGEYEYAYIRPAGVEFPVLLANRTQPGHLADFYFAEYSEAILRASPIKQQRHVRQASHLLSELLEVAGPECVIVRPKSVGKWAVSSAESV